MNVVRHPASRGLTWLRAGLQIFARQPIALLMLVFVQLVVILVPPMMLSVLGSAVSTALMPVLYLGLMAAIRAAEQGETPTPLHLFGPFGSESNGTWKPLMLFGLISGVFMLAAIILSGALIPVREIGAGAAQLSQEEKLEFAFSQMAMMSLAAILSIPIQMASWFSPMLIAWHDQSIGKAVFFSVVAVWRNKWAFLVLFSCWALIVLACTIALSLVFKLLGLPLITINAMALPMLVAFLTGGYCTFWVTYRDIIQ